MGKLQLTLGTAFLILGAALTAATGTAAANAGGAETFNGVIVASGKGGVRTVVSSVVVARGVFNGVGRVVEVENLPGDPDNVSRDDLVFRGGSMHLRSVTTDQSFSIDPRSCVYSVALTQTGTIEGGTGNLASASGTSTATVSVHGVARRDPDGSCSQTQVPLIDVDTFASSGTLAF